MTLIRPKFFYDPLEKTKLNQQQVFLETLFHDNRDGFLTRMKLSSGKSIKYSSKDCKTMESYDKNCDTYITLNGFKSPDKNSRNLRNINCLYFDLDCHDKDQNYIENCIKNTYIVLGDAIKKGIFPKPTMITESGRGLGLFFVLRKSIANTSNTVKQINFFNIIYKCIFKRLKELLSNACCVLEADSTSVCDVSRIVRMPLTKNSHNGKICCLKYLASNDDGTALYYDLSSLNEYVKDIKIYPDRKFASKNHNTFNSSFKKGKIVNFNAYKFPFLTSLMEKLERLQKKFNKACTDKRRELMCFYYYNAAKQVSDDAVTRLYVFNEGFETPLDEKELLHVIKSVNSNKATTGDYEGYYKIKNSTIIERLDLSKEEAEHCGFTGSLKAKKREEKKAANKMAKEKRNAEIISMIKEHPDMTYEMIAAFFKISVRTLKNIASQAGIKRYAASVCDAVKNATIKDSKPALKTASFFENQKCKKMPLSLYMGVSKGEIGEILKLIKGSIDFLKAPVTDNLKDKMDKFIKNQKMDEIDEAGEANVDKPVDNHVDSNVDNKMNDLMIKIANDPKEELPEEQLEFDVG